MIREIDLQEFSIIEHLIDDFLRTTIPHEDKIHVVKEGLLRDLENDDLILIAGIGEERIPFGFSAFRPSQNEITAIHCPSEILENFFDEVFHYLKATYNIIRVSGRFIPESMNDFMIKSGFSMVEYADMSIQRGAVEAISLNMLPEDFRIVKYSDDMKDDVADMLFESFIGKPYTQQYPEQVGSLNACVKILERVDDTWRLNILTQHGIPIGSCLVKHQNSHGRVGLVAVRPSFRGYGLGRAVVSYSLVDSMKSDFNLEVITLSSVNNDPAFNLYQSLGFIMNSVHNVYAWSAKE